MAAELLRDRIGATTRLAPGPTFNDAEDLARFRAMVGECIASKEVWLALDLELVANLSSAALEAVLDMHDALARRGGSLTLVNVNALNGDILRLTGLDGQIEYIGATSGMLARPQEATGGRLGDLLIARGLITAQRIEEALALAAESGKKMGRVLVERGWVKEADLLQVLAQQLAVPYTRLRPGLFDAQLATLIDRATCVRLMVLPLFKVRKTLTLATLATLDPLAMPAIDEIEELSGCQVRPVLVAGREIKEVLTDGYGHGVSVNEYLGDFDDDLALVENVIPDDLQIDQQAAGSPVVNLVNAIIQRAIRDGASDVHIEPSRARSRVRFRIDGMLYDGMASSMDIHPALVSRLKVMANLDITERRLPQDGRIQVATAGRVVDLRFSSLPGIFGEKVVLRVLDKNVGVVGLDRLGMSADNLGAFKSLLGQSHGLMLVTGPTGSGKTTTLYAAVNHLNASDKSLVTIEDPVEYQLDTINQNQVNDATDLSFARLLRHVLRQDPDIIMVGEIRDRETAEIAVQAALTGHLVLSTLHTNDAIGAVTRLVDMGVESYLLSSALLGVVGQRLLRTICSNCKSSYTAAPEVALRLRVGDGQRLRLARGRGCAECYDSGYKGRLAIHELVEATDELQTLMVSNPSRERLSAYVGEHHLSSLYDDGVRRVCDGLTTLEEVGRVLGHGP